MHSKRLLNKTTVNDAKVQPRERCFLNADPLISLIYIQTMFLPAPAEQT